MKEALTYTILIGNRVCTYDCDICISKMTYDNEIGYQKPEVNWNKFDEATEIAINYHAQNVLLTGKGEPTVYPNLMTEYLKKLFYKPFNTRELQTNGSLISLPNYKNYLLTWHDLGLGTIALSVYHYDNKKNENLFKPKNGKYYDIPELLGNLHNYGFKTRLSCVMLKSYIDNASEVENIIQFAKTNNVEQLTLRTADRPAEPLDILVSKFVDQNRLDAKEENEIGSYLKSNGKLEKILTHGAPVYQINGQNVCFTNGLDTKDKQHDGIRHLIFFPQGWLTTSWENVQGGRLL